MSDVADDVLAARNLKVDILNRTTAATFLRVFREDLETALRQCKQTDCDSRDVIGLMIARHAWDMHNLLDPERHLIRGSNSVAGSSLLDLTQLASYLQHLLGVVVLEPDSVPHHDLRTLARDFKAGYDQLKLQMGGKGGLCLPTDPMSRRAAQPNLCTVSSVHVQATAHGRVSNAVVAHSAEFNNLHIFRRPITVAPLFKLGEGHVTEAARRVGTILYIWKRCRPRKYLLVLQHLISAKITHKKLFALASELEEVVRKYQAARDARPIPCPLLRISGDAGTDEQPGEDIGEGFLSHLPPAHAWRLMRTCKAMRDWLVRYDRRVKFRLVQQGDLGDPAFPSHGRDEEGRHVVRKDRVLHLRPQWYFECLYDAGASDDQLRRGIYEVPSPGTTVCPRRSRYVFKLLRDDRRIVAADEAAGAAAAEPRQRQVFNGTDSCILRKERFSSANDFVAGKVCKFSLVIEMLSRFLPKDQNTMRIQTTAELVIVDAQGVHVDTVRYTTVTEPFLCVAKIESAQSKANAKRRQDAMLAQSRERTKAVKQRVEQAKERLQREEQEREERRKREEEEAERVRAEQQHRAAEEWSSAVASGEIMAELGDMVLGEEDWLDTLMDV